MLIDSHCHLYLKDLDADLPAVLERAANQGVTRVICPSIDLETSHKSVNIAAQHQPVFGAVGIHPNYSSDLPGDYLNRLRLLVAAEKVVAIGEIGLDYYRDYCPRASQQDIFRQQLELALELDRPVIIHNRSADADVIAILKESGIKEGVAHCFSGGIQLAEQFLKLGFHISFAGNLTYKNSDLPIVAQNLPLERLLVETDAPFLSPVPFRGKLNEPGRTRFVALKLAAVKGMELAELAHSTRTNAEQLFGLTT
ncbi:MAG: TatD family hydrolase [Candidatus Marinimicrobia bacterium]|nr:TatD family hydrolase [Candidatus Neomarinimicrobiota bacterium]